METHDGVIVCLQKRIQKRIAWCQKVFETQVHEKPYIFQESMCDDLAVEQLTEYGVNDNATYF